MSGGVRQLHELDVAIGALDLDPHPDVLREAWRLLDRLHATLTLATGALETTVAFAEDTAVSLTAWLRTEAGMTNRDAAVTPRRRDGAGSCR